MAAEITGGGIYGTTRFNALRHGVLSRHTVLVWENEAEYQALLAALVAEHEPNGVTEEHLVEELAGIIWRKRRVRMAEAAVYREKLRRSASDYIGPNHVAGAALLPLPGDSGEQCQHSACHRRLGGGYGARPRRREAGSGHDSARSQYSGGWRS